MLLPNAAAEAQSSPVTATATSTATATATPTDYDSDDDGLIDINNLAQLNAVRYDLNGDGKQGTVSAADWATYTAAFSNPASGMGCKPTDHDDDTTTDTQPVCDGYELMMDLNFDTNRDGEVNSSDTYPNWTPIGTTANKFASKFEGSLTNGVMPKISNLTISGSSTTDVGLFGATSGIARIKNVGLVDVNVGVTASASSAKIGALVGNNAGKVIACYSTGKVSAGAGAYPYAGGLVAFNTGTIAASFSRATVYMSSGSEISVGGLTGYNGGTVTAAYAAGAVKGKGGSGFVGGLVGYNDGTINASYSIAPVTSIASSTDANASKPAFLGLSYNDIAEGGTVTVSYWDYIASGVPDDSDTPEGKSTVEFLVKPPASTSAGGIYEGWNTLTINGAVDPTTWNFDRLPPMLTYGGHTTELSGSQRFTASAVGGYGIRRDAGHPREGITLFAGLSVPREYRNGNWIWENSADGIAWTTLVPISGKSRFTTSGAFGTFRFVPNKPEHIGKYIRAKILLTTGDYLYTRVIGKVKAATNAPAALSFDSGHNPPLVEKEVTIASLPSGAKGLWYRCDPDTANNPPNTGCELVGSLDSYTPETVDVDHYLYAHIYYKNSSGAWLRAATGFTPQMVRGVRTSQWRLGR